MAWITVHQNLMTHQKTLRVADLLDVPAAYVTGCMVTLWCWALDNAPDGRITCTARALAKVAGWEGKRPTTFADALETAGFLDQVDGGWIIHNWEDYAGRMMDKRDANAERMRVVRARRKAERDAIRAGNVRTTCSERAGATVQYSTVPIDNTGEDTTVPDPPPPTDAPPAPQESDGFLNPLLRQGCRYPKLRQTCLKLAETFPVMLYPYAPGADYQPAFTNAEKALGVLAASCRELERDWLEYLLPYLCRGKLAAALERSMEGNNTRPYYELQNQIAYAVQQAGEDVQRKRTATERADTQSRRTRASMGAIEM
jgi:hypothetical protein